MEHRQDLVTSENGFTDKTIQWASTKRYATSMFQSLDQGAGAGKKLVDDAFVIFHCRALCDDQRHHACASVRQPVHFKDTIEYSDLRARLLNYGILFSDNLRGKLGFGRAQTSQFHLAAFRWYVARHHRSERV